ncbi:mucin-19 [Pelodytes ibericus]
MGISTVSDDGRAWHIQQWNEFRNVSMITSYNSKEQHGGHSKEPTVTSPPKQSEPTDSSPPEQSEPTVSSPPKQSEPTDSSPPEQSEPTVSSPPKQSEPTDSSPPEQSEPTVTSPPKQSESTDSSPPEQSGECGSWATGSYKTFSGDTYYCKSKSTVTFCRHCVDDGEHFNIEIKRGSDFSIELIKMKIDTVKIEMKKNEISVNGQSYHVPDIIHYVYFLKLNDIQVPAFSLRITQCKIKYEKPAQLVKELIPSEAKEFKGFRHLGIVYTLHLLRNYQVCGLCGDSHGRPGENMIEFFEKHIMEKDGETEIVTSDPDEKGVDYCRSIVSRYFVFLDHESSLKNNLITACAHEYNNCHKEDKRECTCSSFTEMARVCGNEGCSEPVKAWRHDDDVVCEKPQCPENYVFDECALTTQPTCSNPNPLKEKGVVAGCTCLEGLVTDDTGGSKTCIPISECPCTYGGNIYQPGETRKSTCNSKCTCTSGAWLCSEGKCSGVCKIEQGISAVTFDGKPYRFSGNCDYVFLQSDNMIIYGTTSQATNAYTLLISVTISITSEADTNKFTLNKEGTISNKNIKDQNYYSSSSISIIRLDTFVYIHVFNGVSIAIETGKTQQVYISVPTTGFENTKGLCGSYDFNQGNDFMSHQNILEPSPDAFATSWQMSACPTPSEPACINLDNGAFAETHCSEIKNPNGPFSSCHLIVDYREHVENCELSTCTSNDPVSTLCTSLGNYAKACAQNGVNLPNWRNEMCKHECKNNQIIQLKYASCYRTCHSISSTENHCEDQNIVTEACGCPDDLYMNTDENCVPKEDCDCHLGFGTFKAHSFNKIDNKLCKCSGGRVICEPTEGQTQEECTGGSEYVDCKYPDSQRRVHVDCSTKHLPNIHDEESCESGCYCPISMVRSSSGECIQPSECPCLFGGKEYTHGNSVTTSCNECVCNKGLWECESKDCQSSCHVYGDGQYKSFDQKWFSFYGLCQYTLVEDNSNTGTRSFSISIQSQPCCQTGITCSRQVVFSTETTTIIFDNGEVKTENSEKQNCSGSQVTRTNLINTVGMYLTVEMKGVSVVWDKHTRISVYMDKRYNGKVSGLCGNSNGDIRDDFRARDGSVVAKSLDFADSWRVDPACKNTEKQVFPCEVNPYCKPQALRKCLLIKGPIFKECHGKIDPAPYYDACVQEACACDMEGKHIGYCTAVSVYAHACAAAGVCIDWRSKDLCPVACSYYNKRGENIWHYQPCGTAQLKTCNNQEAGQKFATLLEGCYPTCPDNAPYLDENTMACVSRSKCSCNYNNKIYAANSDFEDECGRTWVSSGISDFQNETRCSEFHTPWNHIRDPNRPCGPKLPTLGDFHAKISAAKFLYGKSRGSKLSTQYALPQPKNGSGVV